MKKNRHFGGLVKEVYMFEKEVLDLLKAINDNLIKLLAEQEQANKTNAINNSYGLPKLLND